MMKQEVEMPLRLEWTDLGEFCVACFRLTGVEHVVIPSWFGLQDVLKCFSAHQGCKECFIKFTVASLSSTTAMADSNVSFFFGLGRLNALLAASSVLRLIGFVDPYNPNSSRWHQQSVVIDPSKSCYHSGTDFSRSRTMISNYSRLGIISEPAHEPALGFTHVQMTEQPKSGATTFSTFRSSRLSRRVTVFRPPWIVLQDSTSSCWTAGRRSELTGPNSTR